MAAPPAVNWQAQILRSVGAPVTPQNLLFVNDWAKAEGGGATNNPFNTTQPAAGASSYNSVGVRNYRTPQQGIQATVQTLENGRYGNILSALRQGTSAKDEAAALADSPWGTGSLVLKMLGGQPQTAAGPPISHAVGSALAAAAPARPQAPAPAPTLTGPSSIATALSLLGFDTPEGLGTFRPPAAPTLPGPRSALASAASSVGKQTLATGKTAVQYAKQQLGVPYQWGGETAGKGFDCSGLLQAAWKNAGVSIPRTTYDQWQTGKPVPVGQLEPGDAVFFKGSDSKTVNGQVLPGHVGIYLGGGKIIEAPHTGASVEVSTLAGRSDLMGARRYA